MNTAQMPDLPTDWDAAKSVVRKMLMDDAIVLLKASGLKYTNVQFDVPISFDDRNTQNGDLAIDFDKCTDADVQAMTDAILGQRLGKGRHQSRRQRAQGPPLPSMGQEH